ncbi:MAG TPA: glycogen synthase [Patescibacteria group bacterium]
MRVVFLASECAPLAKVGGLADVVGSLPKALERLGNEIAIIIPRYGNLDTKKYKLTLVKKNLEVEFNKKVEKFNLYKTKLPQSNDIEIYLIENPIISSDGVYLDPSATSLGGGKEESVRFSFFSKAALEVLLNIVDTCDVIHLNDWHVSIVPALIKQNFSRFEKLHKAAIVLTIHNLGHSYQGISDISILKVLELNLMGPQDLAWNYENDGINFLMEGILGSDMVSTVSPSYAKEITTAEYCEGLCDVIKIKEHRMRGILNGIDYQIFDPQKDPAIFANYSIENFPNGKLANKRSLQKETGLPQNDDMLIGLVSRIDDQKGIDLVIEAIPRLAEMSVQLIILGTGVKEYEEILKKLAKNSNSFKFFALFDAKLASKIYAASDVFLMPSKFEPCGLGQMISMRYGTLPIVRATGGLKDTVEDGSTGFVFEKYSSSELVEAVQRTMQKFSQKGIWNDMIKLAMQKDFSWQRSAQEYVKLYEEAVKIHNY